MPQTARPDVPFATGSDDTGAGVGASTSSRLADAGTVALGERVASAESDGDCDADEVADTDADAEEVAAAVGDGVDSGVSVVEADSAGVRVAAAVRDADGVAVGVAVPLVDTTDRVAATRVRTGASPARSLSGNTTTSTSAATTTASAVTGTAAKRDMREFADRQSPLIRTRRYGQHTAGVA